jgi:predicted  nucleic acid-binding Zn-ribbon protein
VAQVEAAWQTTQAALQQEEAKYKRMYAQLKQQRQGITERLGADALALYTQLAERKAGVAVAVIQNGACSACNVSLPTGVVNGARVSEGNPVYCPSCGRILFSG